MPDLAPAWCASIRHELSFSRMSHSIHVTTEHASSDVRGTGKMWPALIDAAVLVLTAPLLYFPDRMQGVVARICACETGWLVPLAVVLLALLWPVRRVLTGRWAAPLAGVGWALWFWFLVMLPVSVWAAPPLLRDLYAWPRSYILVWNFTLFWSVLSHASTHRHTFGWAMVGWLATIQAIALLAPFGMEPRTKLPIIGNIQEMIPRPLMGFFASAETGFSTNQLAGVLLYVLPLLVTICVAGLRGRGWRWWLLLLSTGWIGATMVLTQSRGGLLGLLIGLLTLPLLTRRWGWYALGALGVAGTASGFLLPPSVWEIFGDAPVVEAVGGIATVQNFRATVWEAALLALQDFFFTGMGLGTFRILALLLYPMPGISADFDLAHAHNFFLQTGLDFGVPGLIAILVLYVAAVVQLVRLAHWPGQHAIWSPLPFLTPRVLAIGWMGCMVGQTLYSLFDAVSMGSKPNFVWWWWLALILAAGNCLLHVPNKAATTEAAGNVKQ